MLVRGTPDQNILTVRCGKIDLATITPGQTHAVTSNPSRFCDDKNEVISEIEVQAGDGQNIWTVTCARLDPITTTVDGCFGACCCGQLDTGCLNEEQLSVQDEIFTMTTGSTVTDVTTDQQYFCSSNLYGGPRWLIDLDEDEIACDLNYRWTGTMCCGDDKDEYYNDPEGKGACWGGNYTPNRRTANQFNVIADNGSFYSCFSDDVSQNAPLFIAEQQSCDIFGIQQDYSFCDPHSERWKNSPEKRDHYSEVSWQPYEGNFSCCCIDIECWDGFQCVASQHSSLISTQNDYRCINGQWEYSTGKYSLYSTGFGACNYDSQCLFDLNGNTSVTEPIYFFDDDTKNPACINTTDYILDDYCKEGTWQSRTRLITNALLNYAKDTGQDYTLFCSDYEETLNLYDYDVNTLPIDVGFFEQDSCKVADKNVPCVNNLCILKISGHIFVGTSFNAEQSTKQAGPVYSIFGYDSDECSEHQAKIQNKFYDCQASKDELYYNPAIRSYIYGKVYPEVESISDNFSIPI
jgi:hypothetical protein